MSYVYIYVYTLWLFNIATWNAMECHGQSHYKWRFLARKIIYKWADFPWLFYQLPDGYVKCQIYIDIIPSGKR